MYIHIYIDVLCIYGLLAAQEDRALSRGGTALVLDLGGELSMDLSLGSRFLFKGLL